MSKRELAKYKIEYKSKKDSLGLNASTDYYYDNNINLFKSEELKKVGVDLKKLDKVSGKLNFKLATVMSNKIISGTVIKRKYTPNDSRYKTTYYIKVSSYIKGEGENILKIKTHSGLLPEAKGYTTDSNDYQFFLGEKVILYLIPTNSFTIKKVPKKKFLISKNKNLDFWYVKKKLIVKSGYVFDGDDKEKIGELNQIKKNISEIIKVNKL